MAYATGSTGLAITVRGSSRRIMIMRFRPANIRLINRRLNLPRLLLALSSGKSKNNDNDKNNPIDSARLTGSLHIRPNHSPSIVSGFLNRISIRKRRSVRTCMGALLQESLRDADFSAGIGSRRLGTVTLLIGEVHH